MPAPAATGSIMPVLSILPWDIAPLLKQHSRKLWGELPVMIGPDGSLITVPVGLVVGAQSGPTAYVGAGAHGDEYNSMEITRRLIQELDPAAVNGVVIGVPVQNPIALASGQRTTPNQPWDSDLNRQFPGQAGGAFTARLAHRVFSLVARANLVVDLHTATSGDRYVPLAYLPGRDLVLERSREMAKAFGVEVIVETPIAGTLIGAANDAGIPGIIVELGAGGLLERRIVEFGVRGTQRVLGLAGILDSSARVHADPVVVHELVPVRTECGGWFHSFEEVGGRVRAGTAIGEVTRVPDTIETLAAPCDGVVARRATRGLVMAGDKVFLIAQVRA